MTPKPDATDFCLELILTWGGNPQDTELYREPTTVVVGDAVDADYVLPVEVVATPFELLSERDGKWLLTAPAASTVAVAVEGAPVDISAARQIPLGAGIEATVELGDFTFHLRAVQAPEKIAAAPVDWRVMRWIAGSAAFHLMLMLPFLFSPPDAGALSLDMNDRQREYIQINMHAFEQPEPPVDDTHLAAAESGADATNEGKPMDGAEGAAGDPDERRNTGGGVAVRGDDEDRRVPLTANDVRSMSTLGTIAAVAAQLHDISSPFGSERANGWSAESFWGPLIAAADGFGPGSGGFGMVGTGRGGCSEGATNCAEGTVGVGDLDTIGRRGGCSRADFERLSSQLGRAAAMDRCSGTSRTVSFTRRDREGGVPTIRPGNVESVGGLSKEEIRRVVRRNIAQVRHCYEQGLVSQPDLAGRVSVAFIIAPTGAVSSSQVATSDIASQRVETCVAGAVRRWPFPQSPGVTSVTYPFVLTSAQ